jgi:hypothetical protein
VERAERGMMEEAEWKKDWLELKEEEIVNDEGYEGEGKEKECKEGRGWCRRGQDRGGARHEGGASRCM